MLELNTRKLEIKFNGDIHCINFPTVKQMSNYSDEYEKSENKLKVISEFLVSLGLNKDVTEKLELDHLEKILGELTSTKK